MRERPPLRRGSSDRARTAPAAGRVARTPATSKRRPKAAAEPRPRGSAPKTDDSPQAKGNEQRMVEAAVRRLARGHEVSIEEIAVEAGLSRATAYRAYSRQKDILETIIQRQLDQVGIAVSRYVEACKTFEDALILGIIESVRHVRSDRVFVGAVTEAEYRGLTDLLINSHARVMPIFEQVWGRWLARARQSGEFPSLPGNQQIFEYVRCLQLVLLTSGQSDAEAKDFIHRMVGPVVRSMRSA